MPAPNTGETREDFLKRCMADPEANGSFPDNKQRYAFCNSQWNNKKSSEEIESVNKNIEKLINPE